MMKAYMSAVRSAMLGLALLALAVTVALVPRPGAAQADDLGGGNLFLNYATGKCLDLPGYGKGTVNGPVLQYECNPTDSDNQLFTIEATGLTSEGRQLVVIRNVKDGLCLDLANYGAVPAGTAVTEYYCRPTFGDNQLFWFKTVYLPSAGTDLLEIVNHASGLCLDVAGVRTGGNGARINVYTCSVNDDHLWMPMG